MKKFFLFFFSFIFIGLTSAGDFVSADIQQEKNDRVVYSVIIHSPGHKWVDSLSFRDQPGIEMHVNYMAALLKDNKLVLGGPFLDNSGGMVIYDGGLEEAEMDAYNDPGVKNGLLSVKVKPWMVVMSRD